MRDLSTPTSVTTKQGEDVAVSLGVWGWAAWVAAVGPHPAEGEGNGPVLFSRKRPSLQSWHGVDNMCKLNL